MNFFGFFLFTWLFLRFNDMSVGVISREAARRAFQVCIFFFVFNYRQLISQLVRCSFLGLVNSSEYVVGRYNSITDHCFPSRKRSSVNSRHG